MKSTARSVQCIIDDHTRERHQEIKVYTDGACMDNGKANARCRAGVWFGPEDPRNLAIRIPGNQQSNQVGEVAAILAAIKKAQHFSPLEIITDSRYAKEGLTMNLQHWEDQGWIGLKNARLFQKVAYLLRCRSASTTFTWVKSHRGNQGNKESDRLAKEGANKQTPDELDLDVPDGFNIQGVKLRTMTQALAYKGIMEKRKRLTRESSEENIKEAKRAIVTINKTQETAEMIWTELKKPVLRHRVQQFLFKAMHNTYMIGGVWNEIPDHQDQAVCTACNKTESM